MNLTGTTNKVSFKSGYIRIFAKPVEKDARRAYKMAQEMKIAAQDTFGQYGIGAEVPKEIGKSGFREAIIDLRNNTREQVYEILEFIRKFAREKQLPVKIEYQKDNYQFNLVPKGQLGFDKSDAYVDFHLKGKL